MAATASTALAPADVAGRRLCGAKRRKKGGAPCELPAGWNTSHPGYGRCRLHGGMTQTHVKAALREAGRAMMRVDVQELDVNPLDAMLYTVRRFSALALCYRGQMAAVPMADKVWEFWRELEREALNDQRAAADAALRAGVAERQVRIAERTGQRIASALDDALEPCGLSAEQRAGAVERFVSRLQLLEQGEDG